MKDTHSFRPAQDPTALISLVASRRPGEFSVRLNTFPRPRFIGTIRGNTYHKRINEENHVLHNSASIGINAALLFHPGISLRWIVVDLNGRKLVTTKPFILAHGRVFSYGRYEPQIALPLDLWGKQKAEAWEAEEDRRERIRREKQAQGDLFGDRAA